LETAGDTCHFFCKKPIIIIYLDLVLYITGWTSRYI